MISGLWAPTMATEGDTSLMDEFTTQGMIDAPIKDIKRCRVYLQVLHIGHYGTSRKYYRGIGQIRETTKQQTEKVELAGRTKVPCRCKKKWANALQGIASEDSNLYKGEGTHASDDRMESGCNNIVTI
jgi:hypothetical protein